MVYGRGAAETPAERAAAAARRAARPAAAARGRRCRWSSRTAKRAPLAERVLVVGNLIGAATVQAVPKINGRLASVNVQLGDPVRRGQIIAKVEDREIQEQVRQAEASYQVARGDDPAARGGPQARADEPRSQPQPARAPAAAEADLRRHRGPPPGGAGAARSRQGAVRAGEVAARRAEDQPRRTPSSPRRSTASSASAFSTRARPSARTCRSPRSSTSARSGWWRTSSRRTSSA